MAFPSPGPLLPGLLLSGLLVPGLLAALALASGCSGPPPAGEVHLATTTLSLGTGGLVPAATASVPRFGVVLFKNDLGGDARIEVARTFGPSAACDTTVGFHADGDRSVTDVVPAGAVVALCFHEAGQFPFTVHSARGDWNGTVTVGGEPR